MGIRRKILLLLAALPAISLTALAHNGETPRLPRRGGDPGGKAARTEGAIPNPQDPARWDLCFGPNLDRILRRDPRLARVSTEPAEQDSARAQSAREGIIEALLAYIEAGDPFSRDAAVYALARIRSSTAVPYLLRLLEPDDEGNVHGGPPGILDLGLAGPGSPVARSALLAILGNRERSWGERTFAALALGLMRARQAAPRLLSTAVSEEEYFEDRCTCILALGLMGDDVLLPEISAFLTDSKWRADEHCMLRAAAAVALQMIGSRSALPPVLKALDDPIRDVRRQAVLSLGVLARPSDESVVAALMNLLSVGDERPLRAYAAAALGEIGDPGTAPALYRVYRDGHRTLAPYALLGLGCVLLRSQDDALRNRYLAPLRASLATEEEPSRRVVLILGLGVAGDPEAYGPLAELLESKARGAMRTLAARLLGYPGAVDHVPALRRVALQTVNPGLGRAAARSLGRIGDKVFVKHLTEEMRSAPDRLARGRAAGLLGEILRPEAAGPLLEVLANEEEELSVRNRAAMALGRVLERYGEQPPTVHPLNPHLPLPVLRNLSKYL